MEYYWALASAHVVLRNQWHYWSSHVNEMYSCSVSAVRNVLYTTCIISVTKLLVHGCDEKMVRINASLRVCVVCVWVF